MHFFDLESDAGEKLEGGRRRQPTSLDFPRRWEDRSSAGDQVRVTIQTVAGDIQFDPFRADFHELAMKGFIDVAGLDRIPAHDHDGSWSAFSGVQKYIFPYPWVFSICGK